MPLHNGREESAPVISAPSASPDEPVSAGGLGEAGDHPSERVPTYLRECFLVLEKILSSRLRPTGALDEGFEEENFIIAAAYLGAMESRPQQFLRPREKKAFLASTRDSGREQDLEQLNDFGLECWRLPPPLCQFLLQEAPSHRPESGFGETFRKLLANSLHLPYDAVLP